jgi:hypothetical protein
VIKRARLSLVASLFVALFGAPAAASSADLALPAPSVAPSTTPAAAADTVNRTGLTIGRAGLTIDPAGFTIAIAGNALDRAADQGTAAFISAASTVTEQLATAGVQPRSTHSIDPAPAPSTFSLLTLALLASVLIASVLLALWPSGATSERTARLRGLLARAASGPRAPPTIA